MGVIVGIDTGGTFTDGVLFDNATNTIIKAAKTPTTHENLMQCIINIMNKLELGKEDDIEIVSLSTTLVTNACVEGKGIRSKLILIGANRDTVKKYGCEYGMPDDDEILFVDGEIGMGGELIKEPDWNRFKEQLMEDHGYVQAYAVVQMWGMVNPSLELKAKEIIRTVTAKPVICGHELSSKLNFMRRAASCLINSQITPLFQAFLNSVEEALATFGIHAPLVIVRSDAGVMSSDYARHKPVETMLSGPAASIWGALSLTDTNEGIVVDIGGTTSDIAILQNRSVKISEQGATVGDYKTATPSVSLKAVGIGGDSEIQVNAHGELEIGPRRVTPICALAEAYPYVTERLKEIMQSEGKGSQCLGTFYRIKNHVDIKAYTGQLSNNDRKILAVLDEYPKDLGMICEETGLSRYAFTMYDLMSSGLVEKSGLTPTDIMHINGDFTRWNIEASRYAVTQFAAQYDFDSDTLGEKILDETGYQIYKNIISFLVEHQKLQFELNDTLLRYAYQEPTGIFSLNMDSHLPVIGIGAPASVLLPRVAKSLNTRFICPEYAQTANAVGAAMGEISVHVHVKIVPHKDINGSKCFKVIGMNDNKDFEGFDEAESYALTLAIQSAEDEARKRGAQKFDITYNKDDLLIAGSKDNNDKDDDIDESPGLLVESVINVYAKSSLHHYGIA